MGAVPFKSLIAPLLRHLNVNPPALDEQSAVRIDFDHLQLQLTPLNDRELLMVASLGALPGDAHAGLAWALLGANDIDPTAPAISVTVIGSERSVILWSRERFAYLDAPALIAMFERLVAKAEGMLQTLAAQGGATHGTPASGKAREARTSLSASRVWER
ncbi:CesT family type III secretion system chaperone [Pseudomonas sp. nanlin1]|uniref:CesT family type III secretion system chaperone n=1 Tax=Pseudomonas sp. nanlin1 TaxID=3040605 RepID=UPI003890BB3C